MRMGAVQLSLNENSIVEFYIIVYFGIITKVYLEVCGISAKGIQL